MNGLRLLTEAQTAGLTVDALPDGWLRVRGPKRLEPLARRLLDHKAVVLAALAGGGVSRPAAPEPPHELSLAERVESGYVNPGWTPKAWANRLCQLADRCAALRPELGATYRTWAKNVVVPLDR